ncbi:hypothetical protein C0995_004217 [Termitomyces sp. Mi166|nr:hypothetical protein C0995_004217 [Termitomyces sp. Mi166\
MVIYEWADVKYLGKPADPPDEYIPASNILTSFFIAFDAYLWFQKIYVCTARAVTEGTCTRDQLGRFILDLPSGKQVNQTSFWSARVELASNKTLANDANVTSSRFWDNPAGNPTPPASNYTSPWLRRDLPSEQNSLLRRQAEYPDLYSYTMPIHYPVRKTGYYCVGKCSSLCSVVPVTVNPYSTRAATDVPYHPSYTGRVLFQNTFNGKLPASDYPKVTFYFVMTLVYAIFAAAWGWLCYQHQYELLPIQYYLSGLVGLVLIEMVANWGYYRYLNLHGRGTAATVFLIVVAILDAARNAMSFFMLLVVSLGLSVVRESLGRTMLKCQILAGAHFIFGILYAVGIVELELESTSALVLLMFVIPLAFTLSGFLLWIMYSLNATIAQLRARKQRYKLKMFQRLYYILLGTVVVIAIFFVVSSLSFSGRLAEDEIAQDEEDAEDYDLEALSRRTRARDDDDNATLVADRGPGGPAHPEVVFEIGDEEPGSDGEDDVNAKKRRLSGENRRDTDHERQGLMGNRSRDD